MKKLIFIVCGIVVLAIAVYALLPFFQNKTLDEALPGLGDSSGQTTTETDSSTSTSTPADDTDTPESFPIVDTAAHPAEGSVRIVESGGTTYVRFENFHTINGPNVRVYLANDLEAEDYVDLGPLKATDGNINYEVPEGVDISNYRYVMHWCVPFGVLFNYAEIK